MNIELRQHIIQLAGKYETADFLTSDPSRFMHLVSGSANQEAMAFVASCLSYGSRKQFFPKIQNLLNASGGEMDYWLRSDDWQADVPDTNDRYYRLHTYHDIHRLLAAYATMTRDYGSIGEFVRLNASTGIEAVACLCKYFAEQGASSIVPKNATSACKRVCMFLRWMVRSESPVDLGLWADFIDRRTLVMPLDTHVVQESCRLGLLSSRTTSMSTARRLTDVMLDIFPDDPLRGDFALFGLGVDK